MLFVLTSVYILVDI